ncbi:G_PROTEIN_RECEP_F1_2 domain-containing protein [Caenorhabditis elegans]|uniref:G_PROTEIN_RECEP_F1_2 domain-containing protein n=1 Tax=Caenorhabditis elegans TaxID=6239 RepID=Q95YE4_CAEEL|nr:G_PROTEIN_RECEP_F1_2 domain-containing protein [Caenorhabditis elegans]CCD63910.2 G_PROTEIN_RECEP_F1_2 domain-containing protein [Caenorhabditis elegans]
MIYCLVITICVFISLIIPYMSYCPLNFDSRTNIFVAACDPNRHPITTFQNQSTVFFPAIAMIVNMSIILWMKLFKKSTGATSSKWEKTIIRQAISTAIYLSIYEIGYQCIRQFPVEYARLPLEARTIILQFRFCIVCSINFLVYFVEARSTRELLIGKIKSRFSVSNGSKITVVSRIPTF